MKISYTIKLCFVCFLFSGLTSDSIAQPTPAGGSGDQNQTVCAGDVIDDIIFDVEGAEPTVVFDPAISGLTSDWNDANNKLTISGAPTTTVIYTVTDDADLSVSGTIVVNTLSTVPTSISGDTEINLGESTTLSAVGGVSGTGASFQWYTGGCGTGNVLSNSSTLEVAPNSTTTYFVRRTGTCNITACAMVTVTVNIPSTAPTSISGNTTICSGETTTLTSIGGTSGTGAIFQWYSGDCGAGNVLGTTASIDVSPTVTTTYFVRRSGVSNTTTCASVTVTVNSLSTPPTSINGVTTICQGESTTLSAIGGTDGTGASYQWYAGGCGTGDILGTGSTLLVTSNATTSYFVRRTGTCNTTTCATVTVTVNTPSTAPTDIDGNLVVCPGESTTLTASGGIGGSGASFQWYADGCGSGASLGSNASVVVSPSSTTTYFVRRTGSCGATTCTSIVVVVNSLSTAPTNISGVSGPICPGACVTLVANGGTLGTGGTYQWYSGNCNTGQVVGTNPTLTVCPTATTTYFVRIDGDCNTTNCASVTVEVLTTSTIPDISGVPAICSGSSTTLTAIGGVLGSGASFQWYQGGCGTGPIMSTSSTYQATTAGTYYVRIAGTCNTTECASIDIIESTTPNITAMTTTVCSGDPFEIIPADGTNGIVPVSTQYTWALPIVDTGLSPGSALSSQTSIHGSHSHNSPTALDATYTIIAVAPGNCVSSFTLTVTVAAGPGINDIPDYTICNGLPFNISPFTSPTAGVNWSWTVLNSNIGIDSGTSNTIPGNAAVFFPEDPNSPAATEVIVTASSQCSSETSFNITVYPTPQVSALSDLTFCEETTVAQIGLDGTPNNVLFDYQASGGTIGLTTLSAEQVSFIPSFTAICSTPPSSTAAIEITPWANNCFGNPVSFEIIVIEEPENPLIIDNDDDNAICGNSYGQIITVQTPFPASYSWTGSGNISIIAGTNNQNCVVNFLEPGQAVLTVVANYGGCTSSSSVTYEIGESPDPPLCATIVPTPDGNGLAILNNNVDSYQWGSIVVASGEEWLQVKEDNSGNGNDQFYYGDLLQDTVGKKIWVRICRDGCCTTIFYPDGCTDSPFLSMLEKETGKSGIRVYPNPSSGIVYLSLPPAACGNVNMLVSDISGKMVFERREFGYPSEVKSIDLTDLTAGIYLIRMQSEDFGDSVVKLLKQ